MCGVVPSARSWRGWVDENHGRHSHAQRREYLYRFDDRQAQGTLAYRASNVIAASEVTVDGAAAILNLGANQSDSVGTVILANGGSITDSE